MRVGFLRRALIGVAGWLVLEEADDLQIRCFRVRTNHLDGHFDAQRLRGKDVFFRRCRLRSPCAGNHERQRKAQGNNSCFHN